MRRRERDRGAATILVLAAGLTFVAAGVTAAGVGSVGVGRHRAQAAADLGALAGAMDAVYGKQLACGRARWFVEVNGGRMVGCAVDGLDVVVRVEVAVRPLPGMVRQASAAARAGPVYLPAAV